MLTGFTLDVYGANFKAVDVQATVVFRQGYVPATVRAAIETALEEWFHPMTLDADGNPTAIPNEQMQFGYYYRDPEDPTATPRLAWSDVMDIIRDMPGVLKLSPRSGSCTLNGAQDDVAILASEFPQLRTVTIIDDRTGLPV